MRSDLPRNHHHRGGVHVGVGNTGDGVGRTGAGSDDDDAGPAADAGIALGHVGSALFVADEDVLNLRVEQSVVGRENRAARVAEMSSTPSAIRLSITIWAPVSFFIVPVGCESAGKTPAVLEGYMTAGVRHNDGPAFVH